MDLFQLLLIIYATYMTNKAKKVLVIFFLYKCFENVFLFLPSSSRYSRARQHVHLNTTPSSLRKAILAALVNGIQFYVNNFNISNELLRSTNSNNRLTFPFAQNIGKLLMKIV